MTTIRKNVKSRLDEAVDLGAFSDISSDINDKIVSLMLDVCHKRLDQSAYHYSIGRIKGLQDSLDIVQNCLDKISDED